MPLLLIITMALGLYAAYNDLAYNSFLMGIFSGKIATHLILKFKNKKIEVQAT
jgi:hypothetical protein